MQAMFQKLRFNAKQQRFWQSKTRFNLVTSGRRSGKTEIGIRRRAHNFFKSPPGYRGFIAAPTRQQVKRIYWHRLKNILPRKLRVISETELTFYYPSMDKMLCLIGMDRPERIEGSLWHDGLMDETGNMKESAWPEHVRPMLSDTRGTCDLIGVPEGRNHYYTLYQYAMESGDPEWRVHHWTSAEILPPEEIEAARLSLDERTFKQEYNGEFLSAISRIYYVFNELKHVHNIRYYPELPLIFCFDFNVSPGVAAIAQEQDGTTCVIDEIWIKNDSNSLKICNELIGRYGNHEGVIYCYGDATGGARGSAKVLGSDWDLIRMRLQGHFGNRVAFRVKSHNPAEKSRINAVNSRLESISGDVGMLIDPKCKHLIRDFNEVEPGSDGSINKTIAPMLTHISDAIGYYIELEYPINIGFGQQIRIAA